MILHFRAWLFHAHARKASGYFISVEPPHPHLQLSPALRKLGARDDEPSKQGLRLCHVGELLGMHADNEGAVDPDVSVTPEKRTGPGQQIPCRCLKRMCTFVGGIARDLCYAFALCVPVFLTYCRYLKNLVIAVVLPVW